MTKAPGPCFGVSRKPADQFQESVVQCASIGLPQIDEDSSGNKEDCGEGHVWTVTAQGDQPQGTNQECGVAERPPGPLWLTFVVTDFGIRNHGERKQAAKEKFEAGKREQKQDKVEQMKKCRFEIVRRMKASSQE